MLLEGVLPFPTFQPQGLNGHAQTGLLLVSGSYSLFQLLYHSSGLLRYSFLLFPLPVKFVYRYLKFRLLIDIGIYSLF